MSVERILITVKTYPTLSRTYGETVCTAGLREDGSWVRIYPVPFRRIEDLQQYHKYEWIECDLIGNAQKDKRPESRRTADLQTLKRVGHIGTDDRWRERRSLVLEKGKVFTNLQELIDGAKENTLSLATFKPSKIIDFVCKEDEREWDQNKIAEMRNQLNQPDLFEDNEWRKTFQVVRKLPYKFYYRFIDELEEEHTMEIMDWEIGALFWRYPNEKTAIEKIRDMYFTSFLKTDLHLFLGTTLRWHSSAPNPWVIVGVAPFPAVDPNAPKQLGLPF